MREIALDRRQVLVAGVVLLAVLAVAGRMLLRADRPTVPAPIRVAAASSQPSTGSARLFVHVVGAVRRPGLYRLKEGSRVADAVARAGGTTRGAQLELVNLAAPIGDGQQVLVPRRGVTSAAPAGGAAGSPAAGPVQLSTATLEQLDALPGVGPVTAQKILAYRQQHGSIRSVDELDAVPGIGPARLEQLRGLVTP
jgi:competence protein ComEA